MLALTGSRCFISSVHTREGGGSRYSLMSKSRTANSQPRNSSANTSIAPARLRIHAPSTPARDGGGSVATAASGMRFTVRCADLVGAIARGHVDLEYFEVIGARDHVVRHAGRLRQ